MSRMTEALESRVLFIGSEGVILADLAALKSTGVTAKADLVAAVSTAKADMAGIKAAVTAAHPTSSQKAAYTTLVKAEATAVTKYKLRVTNILASGDRDGEHLLGTLASLKAHPTSVAALAKVTASFTALQGVFSETVVAGIEANASTTVAGLDVDATALATAIPTTQTPVSAFEGHLAADLTTLATQATAIQSAIATLGAALA